MSVLRFLDEMKFDDDEQIFATPDDSVSKPKLRIMNKNMAPPEANQFRVVLELIGAGSGNDRPGVDIVAVLDVSGSMRDERLEKLKTAMLILIRKLHSMDRLSVITFSHQGIMFLKKTQLLMYQLHPMTEAAQKDFEKIVNGLQHVDDAPHIPSCLQKALEVLNARDDTNKRPTAIMLMSDGDPSRDNGDATKVPLGDVPLYKFSFAHQYEADGLTAINGDGSKGGIFPLAGVDDLSIAFSQCLAELCDIVVEDLELTFTPALTRIDDVEMTPEIEKVYAGNCQQSRDDTTGSVAVLINGELYSGEIRKIMADLLLPAVNKRMTTNVLQITHSYTIEGERFHGLPLHVEVIRTGKLLEDRMKGKKSGKTSEKIEATKVVSDDKCVQNTGNMLVKQGQNLFKGALGFATRDNKKENQPDQNSQAHEGLKSKARIAGEIPDVTSNDSKVPSKETSSEAPTKVLLDTDHLQGAGKYVIEKGQGASKYVIEQGQKIFQGEKLPDRDNLKGAGKYVMEQGQDAGKYMIDQGRKIFQRLHHSATENNTDQRVEEKDRDNAEEEPSEFNQNNTNQPAELISEVETQGGNSATKTKSEALNQVTIEPKIIDQISDPMSAAPELLAIDPLAHLKEQILTAIQYFNSMQDTLKSIQDTLNKANS